MARVRRKIGGARSYKAWKLWEAGEYIVGKYVGSSTDNYDKPNWHIELEEVHMVDAKASNGKTLEAGVVMGLNSAGTLNPKMDDLEIGAIVEIVYNGLDTLPENHKFKGKDCHQIDVAELGEDEEEEISETSLV